MSYPPPPGTPDPNDPYAPQPLSPPPAYPQPYGQYTPPAPTGGNNGLAIGSMATGIVSILLACCCWPLGVVGGAVALVLGYISLNQIKERGQSNRGMAVAGLATGGAAVVLGIVNVIVTFAFNWNNVFYNFN